jgi:hypothetical protein
MGDTKGERIRKDNRTVGANIKLWDRSLRHFISEVEVGVKDLLIVGRFPGNIHSSF